MGLFEDSSHVAAGGWQVAAGGGVMGQTRNRTCVHAVSLSGSGCYCAGTVVFIFCVCSAHAVCFSARMCRCVGLHVQACLMCDCSSCSMTAANSETQPLLEKPMSCCSFCRHTQTRLSTTATSARSTQSAHVRAGRCTCAYAGGCGGRCDAAGARPSRVPCLLLLGLAHRLLALHPS